MANRTSSYSIVIILTLITAGFSLWIGQRSPNVSFSTKLDTLPISIGTWYGQNMEMGDEIKKALNADSILSRQYTDEETGQPLGVLIVYRKYGRRDFAHRPELCYPAAGWEIVQKSYTKVPYAGKDVPARLIVAEKDGRREVIAYWFASGDRTESNYAKQQLWMSLDRLQNQHYGWAFVRVNIPVMDNDEDTLVRARKFLSDAEKPLLSILTGK